MVEGVLGEGGWEVGGFVLFAVSMVKVRSLILCWV